MKKILALTLISSVISAHATELTEDTFTKAFNNYDACFILYDVNHAKVLSEYNPHNRCNQRIAPDSTFKLPLSLMAFNEGIITQNTVFKWNGKKGLLPDWNQNQTPATWLKYSVVWVSQQLTVQLGSDRIQHYLTDFHYGNQDFSGDPGKHNGLTHAWLTSSLKISAVEQLNFLNALLKDELALSSGAVENTQKNLYQGTLANGFAYYGKTGSGVHKTTKLRDGWFVGYIEQGTQRYIFVSNLTDKKPVTTDQFYGSAILKPITIELLNRYFS